MKNKSFFLVFSLLLFSCNKKESIPELPAVKDGSTAEYMVLIEQNITFTSSTEIETHELIGEYQYTLVVKDDYYNIEIKPGFFYFDKTHLDVFNQYTGTQTSYKIPVTADRKKLLKTLFTPPKKNSSAIPNPNTIIEESLKEMIPQLTSIDKNKHLSVLEENDDQITLSITRLYNIPSTNEFKHNIETNETTLKVISKKTGLLISSKTDSVSHGMIFAEEGVEPLTLTISAKIILKSL